MQEYVDFKEMASAIVGNWYNDKGEELLIFYLNEKVGQSSKLTIIDGDKINETIYAIGIEPLTRIWYFDMGYPDGAGKRSTYRIKELDSKKLIILTENDSEISYSRKTDEDFANEMLEGLN